MDAALAHLDAAPATAEARTLMQERTTALEGLGVARRAGVWTRLIRHGLPAVRHGWRVPVLFRLPVDDAAIWADHRHGDQAALLAALGTPAGYPHAAEITAHMEALLSRSRDFKAHHLESLLPRLHRMRRAAGTGRVAGRLQPARRTAGSTTSPNSTRCRA